MKKLKLKKVVLDTLSNEQLQKIIGGNSGDTEGSKVYEETVCRLCTVTVVATRKTTTPPPDPI